MYRLWGKIMKNNDMKNDHVVEIERPELTAEERLKEGMEVLCQHFDLQRPMWFSDNQRAGSGRNPGKNEPGGENRSVKPRNTRWWRCHRICSK